MQCELILMLCETAIHSCDPRDRLIQQFPNGISKRSRRKPFIADTRAFYDKSSNTLNSPTDGLLPICHLIRQRPAECIGRVGVRLADCGVAIGVWVVPELSPSKFKMREPLPITEKGGRQIPCRAASQLANHHHTFFILPALSVFFSSFLFISLDLRRSQKHSLVLSCRSRKRQQGLGRSFLSSPLVGGLWDCRAHLG